MEIRNKKNENSTGMFLFGKLSAVLIIPAEFARECNLDNDIVIERVVDGIFIRKLRQ